MSDEYKEMMDYLSDQNHQNMIRTDDRFNKIKWSLINSAKRYNGSFVKYQNKDHDGNSGSIIVFKWDNSDDSDDFENDDNVFGLISNVTHDYENGILTSCVHVNVSDEA